MFKLVWKRNGEEVSRETAIEALGSWNVEELELRIAPQFGCWGVHYKSLNEWSVGLEVQQVPQKGPSRSLPIRAEPAKLAKLPKGYDPNQGPGRNGR